MSDPKGSCLYNYIKTKEFKSEGNSITEGIGSSRATKNFDKALIDDAYTIDDTMKHLQYYLILLKRKGLALELALVLMLLERLQLAKELGPNKTIVTILCDKSDRYQGKVI